MRRLTSVAFLLTALLVLAAPLGGCDVFGEENEDDVNISPGSYEEFGERVLVNDSVVFEGIAGVHFKRVLNIGENRIVIDVFSDLGPEMGTARGTYAVDGSSLSITIEESTSSYYESGETVRYDDVEIVDSSFRTSFDIGESGAVFRGPGLILTKVTTDESDQDEDGDTSEPKREKLYFAVSPEPE